MGKNKKGYNWKARQVVDVVIDNSETKKIHLEFEAKGNCDELVLPSKKRKVKVKVKDEKITKFLSKKHRAKLEKIVEQKKKKEKRAGLLEALSKVQVTSDELNNLTSISILQTKGLKRYFQEELNSTSKKPKSIEVNETIGRIPDISSKSNQNNSGKCETSLDDPNIVGFEDYTSSESDTDEDCDQYKDEKLKEETLCISNIDEETKNKDDGKDVTETTNNAVCITIKEETERKPADFVTVTRKKEIQAARLKLPILSEEQSIMELVNENPVVIIAGETGSGKTTQVPQFLYEAGYARNKQICVTEPRRIAAISMSHRVAEELNLTSKEVSYLIRFEGNVTNDTKIKFVTDGVLLKEVQNDFLLSKYSAIILDEAHERSVFTDILIGILSRIVPLRQKHKDPLKLIIMSATLRVEDFTSNTRLFKVPPPVINIDARQFPVTVHFNRKTNEDYVQEAFNKIVKIHTKLPDGGILAFVSGQQEVNILVSKLKKTFPKKSNKNVVKEDDTEENIEVDNRLKRGLKNKRKMILPKISLDDYHENEGSCSELEEELDEPILPIHFHQPLWVLPLYSMLPTAEQSKVFKSVPQGYRLCVVSTNIAETSLTIPNIKYVVDSGKTKMKLYDKLTGVTTYVTSWTSKSSADQRAGRAGRLGPGHCYRLYSSALFNDEFPQHSEPEIRSKPIDDLCLQMRCMNIDNIMRFPFPTAPNLLQLKAGEERLTVLGALKDGRVTPLGKAISQFPVLPRFGKMLAISHQQDLLPYTISLVAALSVQEVLLEVPIGQHNTKDVKELCNKWRATRLQWASSGNHFLLGDCMVLLKAVGASEYARSVGKLESFCNDNGLRLKAIVEIRKLRTQLINEICTNIPEVELSVDATLQSPTDIQAKLLRQVLLSGLGDQIAKKVLPDEVPDELDKAKFKYAYRANNMEDYVYLHQGSVLRKTLPEFVVYQEVYETNKIYMRGVTAIEPEWLSMYVPTLCNLSEPLKYPQPKYNEVNGKVYCSVTGTFGSQAWKLPTLEIEHPKNAECLKWLARFFLEGKMFKKLEKYVPSLLNKPSTMVKSWGKLHPRTDTLLKALIQKNAFDRSSIENEWKLSKHYLLAEYLKWVPESAHGEINLLWPPL